MASEEAHKLADEAMRKIMATPGVDEEAEVPSGQGVPSWFGPDYRPTDEAIVAFAGARSRREGERMIVVGNSKHQLVWDETTGQPPSPEEPGTDRFVAQLIQENPPDEVGELVPHGEFHPADWSDARLMLPYLVMVMVNVYGDTDGGVQILEASFEIRGASI